MLARWACVPPASGVECVAALRRAGFRVELEGKSVAAIRRDGAVLARVPLVDKLHPDLLVHVLKTVGIGPARFIECLDA